jgi:hypothetical protein
VCPDDPKEKSEAEQEKPVRCTTYLAGGIENCSEAEALNFRDELREKLAHEDLLIYDPILQEAVKVGKKSFDMVERIRNLKRAGHKETFYDEMWKIWFGSINQNTDLIHLLINLRMRKHIDGNFRSQISLWGDAEAVVRSDFIIVHLPNTVRSVGTIYEVVFAYLFRIPIYLIVPDAPATDVNSSLLFGTKFQTAEAFLRFTAQSVNALRQ